MWCSCGGLPRLEGRRKRRERHCIPVHQKRCHLGEMGWHTSLGNRRPLRPQRQGKSTRHGPTVLIITQSMVLEQPHGGKLMPRPCACQASCYIVYQSAPFSESSKTFLRHWISGEWLEFALHEATTVGDGLTWPPTIPKGLTWGCCLRSIL